MVRICLHECYPRPRLTPSPFFQDREKSISIDPYADHMIRQASIRSSHGRTYAVPFGCLEERGGAQVVYARSANEDEFAIKIISKVQMVQGNYVHDIVNEWRVLRDVTLYSGSPFLAKFFESWQDGQSVYFVMVHFRLSVACLVTL
jgi:hypothetical protein